MKKPSPPRDSRIRKPAIGLTMALLHLRTGMRTLFVLATTCLAILSTVRYCHFTNSTDGIAPSIQESLQHQVTAHPTTQPRVFSNAATNHSNSGKRLHTTTTTMLTQTPTCKDRYVYIHSIPREFNDQLLDECHTLQDWSDMCAALTNSGLGPAMRVDADTLNLFTRTGWYETNQFALDVIFHNRMKQYDCLTTEATKASAIYIPFYAGLEACRTLWKANLTLRDATPLRFASWLHSQRVWKRHSGHDHFMIGGRITWDFRRKGATWGNVLLTLPVMQNVTTLVIESSAWESNDIGIPYPTYFHPSSQLEITLWQTKARNFHRPILFSFAGGSRNDMPQLIRGQIITQCRDSSFCKLLSCDRGACQSPQPVMRLFEQSVFCLQPQGDSATRRSIFDSMLAGCIPVFFHEDSFKGYSWHFPEDQSVYSVLISEAGVRNGGVRIEEVLSGISETEIRYLRERVVEMIPRLVYADPRVGGSQQDAFAIAMKV